MAKNTKWSYFGVGFRYKVTGIERDFLGLTNNYEKKYFFQINFIFLNMR